MLRNGIPVPPGRKVKNGDHTSLAEFIKLPSLLYSSKEDNRGGGGAQDHYKQAALLIEFLRESKLGKKHFEDFLHRMGRVPRNHVPGIEAVFQKVYGMSVTEIDEAWQEYCKKR